MVMVLLRLCTNHAMATTWWSLFDFDASTRILLLRPASAATASETVRRKAQKWDRRCSIPWPASFVSLELERAKH